MRAIRHSTSRLFSKYSLVSHLDSTSVHSRTKHILNWICTSLCLGGIVFLGLRLKTHSSQLDVSRLDLRDAYLLVGLSLTYCISNAFLARAWWHILRFKHIEAPWGTALQIYGLSQLGKYIPGNFLHLAGRQSLGLTSGFPGSALALSSGWEIGLICFCGLLFSLLTLPLLSASVTVSEAFFVLLLLLSIGIIWIRRLLDRHLIQALAWHMTFLTLSGSIFLVTLMLVTEKPMVISKLPIWAAAYVAAWLAGVVTPGAPAGLGVREAVTLLLLDGHFAAPELILAVLLMRIISLTGDGLFFATTLIAKAVGRVNK